MKKNIDKFKRKLNIKLYSLAFVLLLLIGFLDYRIFYIKSKHGEEYEKKAIAQQVTQGLDIITKANRGSILDRNLQVISASNTVYNVILDVRNLSQLDKKIRNKTLTELSNSLEISIEKLNGYMDKNADGKLLNDTNYLVIAKNISRKKMSDIEKKNLSGVYFEEDSMRFYVHNDLAAQTVGFIRGDNCCGLEKSYNEDLTGVSGRIFRAYDSQNNVVSNNLPAQDGCSLVTTLDINIQKFAQDAINKAGEEFKAEHATAIVMDPNTGEIIAMAQYPSFNLNDPANLSELTAKSLRTKLSSLSQEEQLNNLYNVWNNFNVSGTFESGSIFKPIVIAAALDQNVITPNSTFYCGGNMEVADRTIHCWKKTGHGTQDITHILANSCNMGMIQIIQKLGREKFYQYQKDFGYGEKTLIDLPAEQSAKSLMYKLNQLNSVELATSSMGQGFNNTPIQALNSFAAVINGGNLMKPYVVSEIVDNESNVIKKNNPVVMKKVISKETSDFMRKALKSVLTEGTAASGLIEGYNIGGKTGTGEQGKRGSQMYTYSFIGYLTIENPQYIAIALIDKPPIGVEPHPATIVKEIFEQIIKYKQIKSSSDSPTIFKDAFLLEDYNGKNLKDTIKKLNEQSLDYEIIGSGGKIVDSQLPIAGTPVEINSRIYLYASNESDGLIEVPNVINLSLQQAVEILNKNNFEPVIINNDGDDFKVIEQMPSAGVKLEAGSQIKLKFQRKN